MILLRNYPKNANKVHFISFISTEAIIKLNEQINLHYMFEIQETTRESLYAKKEYERKYNLLLQALTDKAKALKANAVVEFDYQILKIDAKHILLQANGFAVEIDFNEESQIITSDDYSYKGELKKDQVYSNDVQKLMDNEDVVKVQGQYPDIGGAHQHRFVSQQTDKSIDSLPLEIDSEIKHDDGLVGMEIMGNNPMIPPSIPTVADITLSPPSIPVVHEQSPSDPEVERIHTYIQPKVHISEDNAIMSDVTNLLKNKDKQ